MFSFKYFIKTTVAGAALIVAQSAWAQQPEVATATAAADDVGVADIVVTAQKRSENLQKVPIAITALTSETLQQRGITGLASLTTNPVIGVSVTPFAGDPSVLLFEARGVTALDPTQATIESSTGIYIDDVYLGRAQGLGSELVDPERIEVLRGPQGTLFGRNSEGGAVRIVTRKPTGEFGGDGRVTIGNYGKRRYEAHLNAPSIGGIALKFDYVNNSRDEFTKNGTSRIARIDRQNDFGGERGEGFRVAGRWEPLPGLTLDYAYDNVKTSIDGDYTQITAARGPRAADPMRRVDASFVAAYHEPQVTRQEGHNFTAAYEIDPTLTLKSITGFRRTRNAGSTSLMGGYSFLPFSGFGIPFVPLTAFTPGRGTTSFGLPAGTNVYAVSGIVPYAAVRQHQFSEEVQLIGKTDQFEFVLGGYYFNEKARDTRQTFFNIMYLTPALDTPVGVNPFSLPFPRQGAGSQTVDSRSFAAFSQVTYTPDFADGRLHVTAGLRYTNDRKEFERDLCAGVVCSIIPTPFKASRFDPAFTLAYDLAPAVNIYAKYAQAYRAGGVGVRSPAFRPFGAETNRSIEAGLKADMLDRRARLNLAVYREKLTNVQTIVSADPANPSIADVVNLPGYVLWGVESELTVVPTEGLTFSLGYAYQNGPGTFRVVPPGATVQDPFIYFVQNYPTHSVNVAADWTVLKADYGALVLHGDYSLSSKFRLTPRIAVNETTNPFGERNIANARLSLQDIPVGPTKVRLSGFVNNVFDVAYPVFTGSQQQYYLVPPRTYGIELSAKF